MANQEREQPGAGQGDAMKAYSYDATGIRAKFALSSGEDAAK